MSERIMQRVDRYLRREDTFIARGLRKVSPEEEDGLRYRTGRKKEVIERVVAASAAVLTAPVVGALATAAKIEDGGSGFYRSERIGQNGEVFNLIKIRTLRAGADQDEEANIMSEKSAGIAADERSTRVGAWMRKWRLDELPQLWQVASGQISLIGMRASPELTFQVMREEAPELAVKYPF